MEQLKLNMIPNGVNPVFHASQYDKGRQIRFVLDETLSGAEVTTSYRAKDGTESGNVQMSVSGNTITDTIPEEVLTDYGIIEGEVNIDGIGSLNFFVEVEKDAYDGGVITTQTATGAIATFETNIETAFVSLKSDINPVQDLHGYTKPWSGGGGKNKLNYDAWKTVSVVNGTATFENNGVTLTATSNDCYTSAPNGFPVSARIPVTEGETITLSWEENTNQDGSVYIFPNGTTSGMVRVYNQLQKYASYTATSGVTFVAFRFGVSNSGVTISYKNIQIEKGSTATSFEPYENICPISGFSALNVTRTGKNLFNPGDVVEGYTSNTSGAINGVNTHNHSSGLIKVVGGEKYIITTSQVGGQWGAWYDASYNFISGFSGYDNPITAPNNAVYCRFTIEYNDNNPSYASNVMFEKGQTRSTYVAYNGQTASVNFGQTVYGGSVDVTGGVVEVTHKLVTFTGDASENWYYTSSLNRVYINVSDAVADITTPIMSNIIGFNSSYTPSDYTGHINPQGNFEIFAPATITNANDWKTWLSSNNIELVYELATPTEISITPDTLNTISGENNVYSDTNGDTEVEYYIKV